MKLFRERANPQTKMKRIAISIIVLLVCSGTGIQGLGQVPVPPPAPEVQLRSSADLDQLLGPIALYPDPLIAQILPAATLPSQVVLADRYVSDGNDPNMIDQQPWDASIQALARYPTVLKWMDDNLDWTTELGQAFLYQQQDVMDSIQRLRAQAQALGNLQSNPEESVITDNGFTEILPADPEVVYVPVYQPEMVYYQRPHDRPWISFGLGFPIGGWLNHDVDWRDHHVIEWDHAHPRPSDWWSRRPSQRPRAEVQNAPVWQPHNRNAITTANRGDRGWNTPEARTISPSRPEARSPQPRGTPAPRTEPQQQQQRAAPTPRPEPQQQQQRAAQAPRPEPQPPQQRVTPAPRPEPPPQRSTPAAAPVRRPAPSVAQQPPAAVSRSRPANGALIGVQSSHQTQQFSNRGQQSLQTISRPAPASRPAPPARSEAPSRSPGGPVKR